MKRLLLIVAVCLGAGAAAGAPASEEEAVAQEIRVEGAFIASPFKLRPDDPVREMIMRMNERAETERAAELQTANQSSISRLLELTRFIPIPLGSSENRVDTFFLGNNMRRDLNPPEKDVLSLSR